MPSAVNTKAGDALDATRQIVRLARRRQSEQNLPDLPEIVADIVRFLERPMFAAAQRRPFKRYWNTVRGWTETSL